MINSRYIIEKKLGEGRSKVFLCRDIEAGGKKLAIKILADPGAEKNEISSFREEYFILKNLNHPNIINVYELGCVITSEDEGISYGCYFFTMDYFPGKSLDEVKVEPTDLNSIITQICSTLFYLHQSNYIYYDLKPENILIDYQVASPKIKFIDFGLAEHLPDTKDYQPKGTAQYIAPEILKKQAHDFRVDIYALGILLYKIVYSKFPFDVEDELQIYKSHLELDFDFPELSFNNKIHNVLKTALAKDPQQRYDSILKILIDLEIPISDEITKDFIPAKIFTNRRDVLAMLRKYISDESSHEVFSIRGYESMGKTFLAEELTRIYDEIILISESHIHRGIEFIRSMMRKIYYHEPSNRRISESAKQELNNFANTKDQITTEDLKKLFHRLSSETNFILVFDSFNLYDEVSQELLKELIPFLQVNKRKVILTEESEQNYTSEFLNNLQEINLSPFTDANLTEYLAKSFCYLYPVEDLRKLILLYADLLPGSIDGFVKDIHLFGMVDYKKGFPQLEANEEAIQLLKSSHNEIYEARLKILDNTELEFVQLMSLFEFPVQVEILKGLMEHNNFDADKLLSDLERKNILQHYQLNGEPVLSSSGMKKYIYFTIKNVSELHGNIAFRLREKRANISRTELSRQFELAGLFDESYEILKTEIESAEIQSAYSYQKQMLLRLLEMPLNVTKINEIKFGLFKVLSKLNDYQAVIKLSEELNADDLSLESRKQIGLLKAKALYGVGDLTNSRELLYTALDDAKTEEERIKIFIEIAYIDYDLSNFEKSKLLCTEIINNEYSDYESKGRCYNLLGLIEHSRNNDVQLALKNFNNALSMYELSGQTLNKLKIEINIGNIYFIMGKPSLAEEFWKRALKTNENVGNLEQEAIVLMNFGVLNYQRGYLDDAVGQYNRGVGIFASYGNKHDYGLMLNNLGEVLTQLSIFDEAIKYLNEARSIFRMLNNNEEEAEVIFTLSKLYHILGDNDTLIKLKLEYQNLINKAVLSDRHYNNFNCISFLADSGKSDFSSWLVESRKIRDNYIELDDNPNLVRLTFHIVNALLDAEMFSEVYNELNADALIDGCKNNTLLEAERMYYFAKLSQRWKNTSLKQDYQYLQLAYELLEDQSVTEITWYVLMSLTEYYSQRGNISSIYEFMLYTKSIASYLISNIKDSSIRSKFLNKPDRKLLLKKYEIIEKSINP